MQKLSFIGATNTQIGWIHLAETMILQTAASAAADDTAPAETAEGEPAEGETAASEPETAASAAE